MKSSCWNSKINNLSWRVDLRTVSKNIPDVNEPIALIELSTTEGVNNREKSISSTSFSMNRDQIGNLVATLNDINQKINELSY